MKSLSCWSRPQGRRGVRAALSMLVTLAACGRSGAREVVPIPVAEPSVPAAYEPADLLIPGDLLRIEFPHRPDLSQSVLVRNDGAVTLPLGGDLVVAGRTLPEVQVDLGGHYGRVEYDPARGRAMGSDYLLGIGDEIEIRFRHVPQLNTVERVRPDGRVSLAMVNSVIAEGKRPEDLEAELTRAYSGSLRHPELVVIVRDYRSDLAYRAGTPERRGVRDLDGVVVSLERLAPRSVYVAGEVEAPGFRSYHPGMTALQALATAGLRNSRSRLDRVLVLRRASPDSALAIYLDLDSDIRGRSFNDLPLRPFDVVIVPRSGVAKVGDFLDQYLYQLVPATRNVNFTYVVGGAGVR